MTHITRNNFAPLRRLRNEQCAINGQQMLVLSLIEDWKKMQCFNIPLMLSGLYHAAMGYSYDIAWVIRLALICFVLFTGSSVIFNLYQVNKGQNSKYSLAESIWFYPLIIISLGIIIGPLYWVWCLNSFTLLLKRNIILVLISYLTSMALFVHHHYQYHMLEQRNRKYQQRYAEAGEWFDLCMK